MYETMEEEKLYLGFKNLGFKGGEEIRLLKGVEYEREPVRVTVLKEYPEYLLIDMEFEKEKGNPDTTHIRTGANKGAMLCGDVLILRVSDNVLLTKDEVGIPCDIGDLEYECCGCCCGQSEAGSGKQQN